MDKLMRLVIAVQLRLIEPIKDKERGATATEYALLVTFIAIAIVAGVTAFGTQLDAFFTRISTKVTGWAP